MQPIKPISDMLRSLAEPECGTLCCRLVADGSSLHAARNSSSSLSREEFRPTFSRAETTIGESKASRIQDLLDPVFFCEGLLAFGILFRPVTVDCFEDLLAVFAL